MSKLKVIETRTKEILENFPETRTNDHALYRRYINTYHFKKIDEEVFQNYQLYRLPSFSSVERAGRKLKAKYKELAGTNQAEEIRREEEAEYRDYYSN